MLLLKKPVDHSQYVLTDGSRGFTSTISGVDPSLSYHLSTKNYVDSNIFDLLGRNKSGKEQLSLGDSSTTVVFNTAFSSDDYALLISIENQVDSPASEYAITITDKTVFGFTVNYSGDIDSDNYYLNWIATLSGSFGGLDIKITGESYKPGVTSTPDEEVEVHVTSEDIELKISGEELKPGIRARVEDDD